jgi:hypothetical protein
VRATAAALIAAVLCGAAPAGAAEPELPARMPHRRECMRLTKQIARYVDDAERANAAGNELWERSTLQHIDRLAARRAHLCPQLVQRDRSMERLAALLGEAAKLAAKYFTMGAL